MSTIAIVGASGLTGSKLCEILTDKLDGEKIVMYGNASVGQKLCYFGKTYTVKHIDSLKDDHVDYALFMTNEEVSAKYIPQLVEKKVVCIDNSSAFRMDPEVPLVVPEVNPDAVKGHKNIIANPNCTTAISLMALCPLHKAFGLKRFFASTYQAVSGTGVAAMQELSDQIGMIAKGEDDKIQPKVYPYQIAYNVIPHVDVFLDNGYTKEEMKMLNETRKIMGLPNLQNATTCVRVPVMRAHSVSINAEFEKPVSVEKAREAIASFPGAELNDDVANKKYPMPLFYQGKEKCGVGRIRIDSVFDNGLAFWVSGDQLWKGAALNAVQIAELIAAQDK